jgi:hypothetical protein
MNVRHGDLLFVPVDAVPIEAKPELSGVVQRGEATGHSHRLADLDAAEVLVVSNWRGDSTFVKVGPLGVSIRHEEHGPVSLKPNTVYQVNRAREWDVLANLARFVAD